MNNTITIFFSSKLKADLFEKFIADQPCVKHHVRFADKVGSKTIDVTFHTEAANFAFKIGHKWGEYLSELKIEA